MNLPSLNETIYQALWLEPEIYAAIQWAPEGIWLALMVVLLAALSESVGQSIILFVNRVRPRRFILALLTATFSRLAGFGVWAASVWLIASYIFERAIPFWGVASAVGLAYAPQLLAFFVLTPFLGNPFSILLSLWSMLAIIVALRTGLGLEMWQAVITAGLGWVLIQVWQRTLGRPIYALGRWLERHAAGVPLELTAQDIIRLRHRPRWLESLPNWKEVQERAESYVRTMQMSRGEQSGGGDLG
ncbi:MAG: hypothetical protein DCC55_13000 [Chloroflexi bacterium]|nr:MAG: hypothetical protein DCC55_13000 [Chloroflexota bacterium]